MTPRLLFLSIALVFGCSVANAQVPEIDSLPPNRPSVWPECDPAMDNYRSELLDLSRHAGWGMFLGGVAGAAYGLLTERGRGRRLLITWNTFIGLTAGMTLGSGVYVVRRVSGYRPPLVARCGRMPPNKALQSSSEGWQ